MSLKPSNAGIYNINALNVNQFWINGIPFQQYVDDLVLGDQFEQNEIDEIRQILLYLNTTGLTTEWVVDNANINAELKTAIIAIQNNITTLQGKTQYITSEMGEGAIIPGGAAVAPSYVTVNPSSAGTEWNQVNLIANSTDSFIKICDDTTIGSGAGRDEIQIKNTSLVRIESSQLSLLGSTTNVGNSSSSVMFPSLTITQPISISGLVFGYVTGSAPAFLVAKILAAAVLPNYTDIFGFETALVSRDKKVVTTNKPVVKDITLYNLDATNVFPVESSYIANGSIAKSCLIGNQNYYVGNGAWEARVDDFGNIGSMTLNDKENKTNKIKISNQNVEIRSNNGSTGNVILHNGCPSGAIQFRKGNDNTDATANAAMEIITPSNALSHLCSQVIIGADTRSLVAQTEVYDPKSKLIVDTTQFAFASTGKAGIHGIQVSNNKAFGDGASGVDTTYVDAANISTKSLTLQDNYTGTTTKTLYTDTNANLMYNGQMVAMGSVAASGGGLTYIITAPTTTTVTTPNFTPATDLTMSGTYTATPNRTVTLSSYANNTNYQLVSMKGLVLASSNPVLDGTYELNQHINYTGSLAASLFTKLYFYANTPASTLLINKTYTGPAGSGTVSAMFGAYVPVPANDLVLVLTSVTFPQVLANSGSANSPLVCTVVNQSGTVLYTFPTVTATNGTTADRTFTPASSPQTITVTSAITSFRFVLTNTAASTPTMSQATAQNVNNANYSVANGSSVKMLLYDGTSNKTALATQTAAIYALSIPLPVIPFVITDWVTPGIQLDEFFVQPSGSTTGHTCVLQFNDGNLSHLHTSIATIPTVTTPTLAQVLVAGNTAGSTALNMNSQDVTNVATLGATTGNITTVASTTVGATTGNITTINATTVNATTLVPTNITGWGVKSIVAGTNVTVSNASGAVTINASAAAPTTVEANASYLINSIATLPVKPTWYGTAASFLNTGNTSSRCQDVWVSATGEYQMFACGTTSGSISQYNRYSSDYGASYADGNILAMGSGVCGSHNGDIVYYTTRQAGGTGRIWKYTAASTGYMATNWGQLFNDLSAPNVDWNKIACSRDGQYVLVGTYNTTGGLVYISANGGSSFTNVALTTNTSQNIFGVAVSADGRYMYATTSENTIKYSNDYGASWNTSSNASGGSTISNPVKICCSATGQIVACTSTTGFFSSWNFGTSFRSNNYGSSSAINLTDCCMSANGQFVLKCYLTGSVGYSDNFGRDWYPEVTLIGSTPDLNCIACSDTGGYVATGPLTPSRTYNLFDASLDIRRLVAGSNISLNDDGRGSYTITVSTGGLVSYPISNYSAVYNGGLVARVTFSNIGVNLSTHRIHGVLQIGADGNFDYPLLIFNNKNLSAGVGSNSTANQPDEFAQSTMIAHGGSSFVNGDVTVTAYQDFSQLITNLAIPSGNGAWIVRFTIDLQRRQDGSENGYMLCVGDWTYTQRQSASVRPQFSYYGQFRRGTNITTISEIGIQSFFTTTTIRYATINLNIEPLPPYIYNGASTI